MITLSAMPAVGSEVSVPTDSGRTRTFKVVRVDADGFWSVDETETMHRIDVRLVVAPAPPILPLSLAEIWRHAEEQKKIALKSERERLEAAAWALRQSVPFSGFGSAAILQQNFLVWLKQAKKLVATKAARVDVAWMESPDKYRRKKDEKPSQPFLDIVTLDFAEDRATAYVWTVSGADVGLSALVYPFLNCRVDRPFVVRVHLATLIEIVALCPSERIDLSATDSALTLATPRNLNHLYSHPIYPITERYWIPGATPEVKPNAHEARRRRRKSARQAVQGHP